MAPILWASLRLAPTMSMLRKVCSRRKMSNVDYLRKCFVFSKTNQIGCCTIKMHKWNEEKKGGRKREKTCTNKKVCVQCVGNSRKLICCAENSIELNGYAIKQVQEQKYIAIQFNELIPNENSQNEMRNESIRSEMLKNWDEKMKISSFCTRNDITSKLLWNEMLLFKLTILISLLKIIFNSVSINGKMLSWVQYINLFLSSISIVSIDRMFLFVWIIASENWIHSQNAKLK